MSPDLEAVRASGAEIRETAELPEPAMQASSARVAFDDAVAANEAATIEGPGVGCANSVGFMPPRCIRERAHRVDLVGERGADPEEQLGGERVAAAAGRVRGRDADDGGCNGRRRF